jgi:uncharacterized membrane protein YgdD (TMEM256/DUF423 family)
MGQGGVWLVLAGLNGALGVIGGALATHGARIADGRLVVAYIDTASRFQLVHALALIGVALLARSGGGRWAAISGWLFTVGLVLFCGGLYLAGVFQLDIAVKAAPYGGFSLIAGWLALSVAGWRLAR